MSCGLAMMQHGHNFAEYHRIQCAVMLTFIYISANRISQGSKVGKSLYSSDAGCVHGRPGRSGKHVGSRGSLQKQTPLKVHGYTAWHDNSV